MDTLADPTMDMIPVQTIDYNNWQHIVLNEKMDQSFYAYKLLLETRYAYPILQ